MTMVTEMLAGFKLGREDEEILAVIAVREGAIIVTDRFVYQAQPDNSGFKQQFAVRMLTPIYGG